MTFELNKEHTLASLDSPFSTNVHYSYGKNRTEERAVIKKKVILILLIAKMTISIVLPASYTRYLHTNSVSRWMESSDVDSVSAASSLAS